MPSPARLTASFFAAGLVALACASSSLAQDYPNKPIRFIVPFPAGSGTDTFSRTLLEEMGKSTGASFVIENRPGALGQIGTDLVKKAAPDGYTVMISSSATHSSGPHLSKSVPYDALRDFTQMARIVTFDVALFVAADGPYKSINDIVSIAAKTPEKVTYGYGSATAQVIAASFVKSANAKIPGVSYSGQPPALTDLIGGQTAFVCADLAVGLPHMKSGRLVPLAIAASKRSAVIPNVPTFTELGLKNVELQGWTGVAGPAGLPPNVVEWWNKNVNATVVRPEYTARLQALAVEAQPISVAEMNDMVRRQYEVWGTRIREAGIQPQ